MTNCDNGYDDRYNNGNEDGNNNGNADSGLGYDDPIFDPIRTPQSCGGLLENERNSAASAAHYVSMRQTIYLPYKYHVKDVP